MTKFIQRCSELIEDERKIKNGKVSWVIFVWAIGIILVLFGTLFTIYGSLSGSVNCVVKENSDIKGDIKSLVTDVGWIKSTLAEKYGKRN